MTAFKKTERERERLVSDQLVSTSGGGGGGNERWFAETLYQYNARQEEKRQTLQVFIWTLLTDQCNKHNLVSYIHTYVHAGITQIQKFATMMVGCGVSHKNTKYTEHEGPQNSYNWNTIRVWYKVLWIILKPEKKIIDRVKGVFDAMTNGSTNRTTGQNKDQTWIH